ncbi:hypothetical protein M427DRAFT_39499 [Gonapodya prolifera JEL478]|uniref:Uncharacterized protein n=1 Tax=Gonapodya prolifera (strain JEL478) TaxID=1344416 RepID=A0A138ZXA9_GONPJ|nr:hypothetical protein M427DRAFT_39499 [Gonapodya prolifera JEL478]|eukprot:KXS09136.1 hypothetical protein M427DRAFT_39499 [Gonapodya prolifera JEL478]
MSAHADVLLISAIDRNDAQRVRSLLASGADPNARKVLHLSALVQPEPPSFSQPETDPEPEPEPQSHSHSHSHSQAKAHAHAHAGRGIRTMRDVAYGESALACAILANNAVIVQILLEAGADPNMPVKWPIANAWLPPSSSAPSPSSPSLSGAVPTTPLSSSPTLALSTSPTSPSAPSTPTTPASLTPPSWSHDAWILRRWYYHLSYPSHLHLALALSPSATAWAGSPAKHLQQDAERGVLRVNKRGGKVALRNPVGRTTYEVVRGAPREKAEVVQTLVRYGAKVDKEVVDAVRARVGEECCKVVQAYAEGTLATTIPRGGATHTRGGIVPPAGAPPIVAPSPRKATSHALAPTPAMVTVTAPAPTAHTGSTVGVDRSRTPTASATQHIHLRAGAGAGAKTPTPTTVAATVSVSTATAVAVAVAHPDVGDGGEVELAEETRDVWGWLEDAARVVMKWGIG